MAGWNASGRVFEEWAVSRTEHAEIAERILEKFFVGLVLELDLGDEPARTGVGDADLGGRHYVPPLQCLTAGRRDGD